jgi:hypothetical protein
MWVCRFIWPQVGQDFAQVILKISHRSLVMHLLGQTHRKRSRLTITMIAQKLRIEQAVLLNVGQEWFPDGAPNAAIVLMTCKNLSFLTFALIWAIRRMQLRSEVGDVDQSECFDCGIALKRSIM